MDARPNLRYAIKSRDGNEIWPEKQWQWSRDRVAKALENDELVFTTKGEKTSVSYKQYLRDSDGEERGRKPQSIIFGHYTQHGTNESVFLFGQENKFSFPKPEGLINYIIECCTTSGDLVLDSFAGSGTTGAVAHKMGRRWIMVELGDHAVTHIVPRLKKVIDGTDPGGVTEATGWKGGGGFRFYRLAPSLLSYDKWGNWVISKEYDAAMLAEAMCRHMGFTYAPSQDPAEYWMHGRSTETDFIYVTTASLTHDQLRAISEDVGPDRTLKICCKAFSARVEDFDNLTVVKIPHAILARCEWGRDDYSLRIAALPEREEDEKEAEAEAPASPAPPKKRGRKPKAASAADLFGDEEG